MADTSKALVLAGGGVAGIAWELGMIDGLRRHGVDLTDADLILGRRRGRPLAPRSRTGQLDWAVASAA